jgi:hypothetical protein
LKFLLVENGNGDLIEYIITIEGNMGDRDLSECYAFKIEYCNPRVGYPYLGTGSKATGTKSCTRAVL